MPGTRDPYTDVRQVNTFLFDGRKHKKRTPKPLLWKFSQKQREEILKNTKENREEDKAIFNQKVQHE